jgi:DNA repair protein RecO (recombination protein O)
MHALGPAYVLHSRPYRDTSALVDLLTLHHGLVRVVWRGARGGRRHLAQPFLPLLIDLRGRGELKTLHHAEVAGPHALLQGQALFSGMYLNELLVRLLGPDTPQPLLFAAYQQAIAELAERVSVEPVLRTFESRLIEYLGYGFSLTMDVSDNPLDPDSRYAYISDEGLQRITEPAGAGFPGSALLAIAAGDWDAPGALITAKRLMRQALAPHLGDRPLVSRQLFLRPGPEPREETSHD